MELLLFALLSLLGIFIYCFIESIKQVVKYEKEGYMGWCILFFLLIGLNITGIIGLFIDLKN